MEKKDCIKVGKVSRLHGYKGEVSLKLDHDLPFDFDHTEIFFLDLNGKLVPHFVEAMRFTPKGFALTFFDGVDNEQRAKSIVSNDLYLPRTELLEMEDDEYILHELVGFIVTDLNYGEVGPVEEVIEHPGNVLLSIDGGSNGPILIPLTEHFVLEVDKKSQTISVETPEGLIELNAEGSDH